MESITPPKQTPTEGEPNETSETGRNNESQVGFRFIVDTVDGLKYRLLKIGNLSAASQATLDDITNWNRRMVDEQSVDDFNQPRFLECLGSYVNGLQKLVDDNSLWETLPEYIPADEDTIEMGERIITDRHNPDRYLPGTSNEKIAIAAEETKKKWSQRIRGQNKEEVREELKRYIVELTSSLFQAVSPESHTIN